MSTQTLTGRQARIAEHLAGYDFNIEYKKGTANPADGLSRRPNYFRGFKDIVKRKQLQGMLPTLQQKMRIIGLDQASSATAERGEGHRVGCGDSTQSDSQTILPYEQSDQLLAAALETSPHLGSQKLTRAASGTTAVKERTACARKLAGTVGFDLLVPRSTVAAAAVDDNAFTNSPETLTSLIRGVQARDAFVQDIRRQSAEKTLGTGAPAVRRRKDSGAYTFDKDGLLRRDGKVYVPRSAPVRQEILYRNHDDPVAGHYSRTRTAEVIARKYFWPNLTADVKEYVEECDVCQRIKPKHYKPYSELQPLEPPSRLWRSLSIDFVAGLLESKGFNSRVYDSVLVVVDRFSKMVRYFPVNKTIDAPALAELFYQKIVMFTRPPDDIVSDRGSIFTSEFWSTLCYYLAVKRRLSTAFHPQTDGQTERLNQQLKAHLRIYCNYDQDNWARLLYAAAFAYNLKTHASHSKSLIEIATGTPPSIPNGIRDEFPPGGTRTGPGDIAEQAREWLTGRYKEFERAKASLTHAAGLLARYYNRHIEAKHFNVDDKVLVSSKNIYSKRPHKKLDNKWLSPFTVVERVGKQVYKLNLPPSMRRLYPTFYVSLLEPYKLRAGYQPPPVDDLEEGDNGNRYEIEKIVRHRVEKGKRLYRVR